MAVGRRGLGLHRLPLASERCAGVSRHRGAHGGEVDPCFLGEGGGLENDRLDERGLRHVDLLRPGRVS